MYWISVIPVISIKECFFGMYLKTEQRYFLCLTFKILHLHSFAVTWNLKMQICTILKSLFIVMLLVEIYHSSTSMQNND